MKFELWRELSKIQCSLVPETVIQLLLEYHSVGESHPLVKSPFHPQTILFPSKSFLAKKAVTAAKPFIFHTSAWADVPHVVFAQMIFLRP